MMLGNARSSPLLSVIALGCLDVQGERGNNIAIMAHSREPGDPPMTGGTYAVSGVQEGYT